MPRGRPRLCGAHVVGLKKHVHHSAAPGSDGAWSPQWERRDATIVLVGVLAAALLPMVVSGEVFGARDAAFSGMQMAWLQDVVLRGAHVWSAPLGAPLELGTTRADWVAVQALFTLPLRALGMGPERTWLAASVLGVVLTAAAVYEVSRRLTFEGPHNVVAGVLGALGPAVQSHLQHANLVWHVGWIVPAGLVRVNRPVLAGVATMLAFHAGVYTGIHAIAAVGVCWACQPSIRTLVRLVAGGVVVLPTLIPVWLKYRDAAARYGWEIDQAENLRETLDLSTAFGPLGGAPLHEAVWGAQAQVSDPVFPGFILGTLGIVGLVRVARDPRWRPVVTGTIMAAILALGPHLVWNGHPVGIPGPGIVMEWAWPGGLRSPARWIALAHVGLALGVAGLIATASPTKRWVLTAFALGAWWAETPTAATMVRPVWPAELVQALSVAPAGALLDKPGQDRCGHARFAVVLETGRPLLGGNFARFSKSLQTVNRILYRWPEAETQAFLSSLGGAVVVEHPPLPFAPEGVACSLVAEHRLCTIPGK